MEKINAIKRNLKNAEGMRLLEKTKLEYSKEIIKELEQAPEIVSPLIEELEITEPEFFKYLSGEQQANITLYDQSLILTKRKKSTMNKNHQSR